MLVGQEVVIFRKTSGKFPTEKNGCSQFQFCSEFFSKWGIFSLKLCVFAQKIFERK